MLQEAIEEGDTAEEKKIRRRINEANTRQYWSKILSNAEQTAQSGFNLEATIGLVKPYIGNLEGSCSCWSLETFATVAAN